MCAPPTGRAEKCKTWRTTNSPAVRHLLGIEQRTSPKNNARHLGSDKLNGVGAFLFWVAVWRRQSQKSPRATGNLEYGGIAIAAEALNDTTAAAD